MLFRSKYKIYYLVKLSAGRDSIVSVALSLPRSKFYITICLILIILFAWDNLFALYSFVKFGTGRLPLATVCFIPHHAYALMCIMFKANILKYQLIIFTNTQAWCGMGVRTFLPAPSFTRQFISKV